MYKFGDIVYFDKLVFKDVSMDNKKNRPCIVVGTYTSEENKKKIFCMPLTSNVKKLNKYPENHMLISNVIYNSKKLNFVKLNCLFIEDEENANVTGISLDEQNIISLKYRIKNYKRKNEMFNLLIKVLELKELKEQNKENNKKLERKLRRREAKKYKIKESNY